MVSAGFRFSATAWRGSGNVSASATRPRQAISPAHTQPIKTMRPKRLSRNPASVRIFQIRVPGLRFAGLRGGPAAGARFGAEGDRLVTPYRIGWKAAISRRAFDRRHRLGNRNDTGHMHDVDVSRAGHLVIIDHARMLGRKLLSHRRRNDRIGRAVE